MSDIIFKGSEDNKLIFEVDGQVVSITREKTKALIEEMKLELESMEAEEFDEKYKNFNFELKNALGEYCSNCYYSHQEYGLDYDHDYDPNDLLIQSGLIKGLDKETLTSCFEYILDYDEYLDGAACSLAVSLWELRVYPDDLLKEVMSDERLKDQVSY